MSQQTTSTRSLWRYASLPPPIPRAPSHPAHPSQFNKLLSLPGDITNLSPREFWTPIVMMTTGGYGYGGGQRVVGIMGDLLRDKVLGRSLAWYPSLYPVSSLFIAVFCLRVTNIYSHLFTQLIQSIPQSLIGRPPFSTGSFRSTATATITLRNELGTSLPVNLDKSTRTDIFSAITRDTQTLESDGSTDTASSSSEPAWIGYDPVRVFLSQCAYFIVFVFVFLFVMLTITEPSTEAAFPPNSISHAVQPPESQLLLLLPRLQRQ